MRRRRQNQGRPTSGPGIYRTGRLPASALETPAHSVALFRCATGLKTMRLPDLQAPIWLGIPSLAVSEYLLPAH